MTRSAVHMSPLKWLDNLLAISADKWKWEINRLAVPGPQWDAWPECNHVPSIFLKNYGKQPVNRWQNNEKLWLVLPLLNRFTPFQWCSNYFFILEPGLNELLTSNTCSNSKNVVVKWVQIERCIILLVVGCANHETNEAKSCLYLSST